jgi:ribonuclease-3
LTVWVDLERRPLLRQALTHRSHGHPHNERLEYLGDALIGWFAADLLYRVLPKADEGELTRRRAELVRESSLAELARRRGLGDLLLLGGGELKSGGWRRESILADAYEAVVAAICLEQGIDAARAFAEPDLLVRLEESLARVEQKDAKTQLQEWLQHRGLPRPVYRLLETSGPEHARRFEVACELNEPALSTSASGDSRKAAEQLAASQALSALAAQREERK